MDFYLVLVCVGTIWCTYLVCFLKFKKSCVSISTLKKTYCTKLEWTLAGKKFGSIDKHCEITKDCPKYIPSIVEVSNCSYQKPLIKKQISCFVTRQHSRGTWGTFFNSILVLAERSNTFWNSLSTNIYQDQPRSTKINKES